jgi:hypothetical protein
MPWLKAHLPPGILVVALERRSSMGRVERQPPVMTWLNLGATLDLADDEALQQGAIAARLKPAVVERHAGGVGQRCRETLVRWVLAELDPPRRRVPSRDSSSKLWSGSRSRMPGPVGRSQLSSTCQQEHLFSPEAILLRPWRSLV